MAQVEKKSSTQQRNGSIELFQARMFESLRIICNGVATDDDVVRGSLISLHGDGVVRTSLCQRKGGVTFQLVKINNRMFHVDLQTVDCLDCGEI